MMDSTPSLRILHNARIHTMDPDSPQTSAIVIHNDRIVAVGDDSQIKSQFIDSGEFEDLGGLTITPGFTDSHIHLKNYGLSLQKIDSEVNTLEECLDRVKQQAERTPRGEWILGHGWNQNLWSAGFGTASDLDAVAPHHPVYLTAKSLHAGWANSEALKRAQINSETVDPHAGRIQRNDDGQPTGILFESAMALVSAKIPAPIPGQVKSAILNAQGELFKLGLTGVHDFDRRECFVALQELHNEGSLKIRVTKSIPIEELEHAIELGLRTGFGDDFLRIGSVKVFSDGALGPHTAAMLSPYEEDPDNVGMLFLDQEALLETGCKASQNGLSLAVHAIGDRANHEVLDAFEQLRAFETENQLSNKRHRIEHVQLLHSNDLPRLAELDIIASMQPIHAISDMHMADRHWGERAKHAYAWRTLLKKGTRLAFGSDAPVESPNPFWGIHAAVTRQAEDGSPSADGWYPEQRVSVHEAMFAYTMGAAYAAGVEDRVGKLVPGFLADLILLDVDPFTCSHEQLRTTEPTATMVAGEWVWDKR